MNMSIFLFRGIVYRRCNSLCLHPLFPEQMGRMGGKLVALTHPPFPPLPIMEGAPTSHSLTTCNHCNSSDAKLNKFLNIKCNIKSHQIYSETPMIFLPCYYVSRVSCLASRFSPLASRLSSLASRLSPLDSRLSRFAFSLSPLASRLSPLASRPSPLASRFSLLASRFSPLVPSSLASRLHVFCMQFLAF